MGLLGRWSRNRAALPPDRIELIERHVRVWRDLDEAEQETLAAYTEELLVTRRWEAARGFDLTDRVRTVIAAQASLLVLGLGIEHYDDVGSIIVHPTTMRVDRTSAGPVVGTETCGSYDLLGEAEYGGPVVVAWDAASRAARHPNRGHDVVLHEFAHKLDMLDGTIDGTPPISDPELFERWVEVCTREYEHLVASEEPDELIDDYATTDAGEFFAVVTESFFTVPLNLRESRPELYAVFQDYYRQDPASRAGRAGT